MMELIVDLGLVVLALTLLVGGLAVWRIGQVVSWRALAMTARATGSFTECVAFIRFCVEDEDRTHMDRSPDPHVIPTRAGLKHTFEEWPRTS